MPILGMVSDVLSGVGSLASPSVLSASQRASPSRELDTR